MEHSRRVVLVLFVVFGASSAWAQSEARLLLDRMSHGFRELNYRGVFTYEYGSQMESMRIIHAVRDGVERERMVHLNGESREFYRDGHALSCIHPGHQKLRLGGQLPGGPFARSIYQQQDVADYYQLTLGQATRVAERSAQEVVVEPHDAYRYGFRLFLDEQTGLLLKSLTVGPRGEVLERFQFVDIDIGVAIDEGELLAPEQQEGLVHHHLIEQAGGEPAALGWRAELLDSLWLPPGFVLSARSEQVQGGSAVYMGMFTDGLATLTVILEATDEVQRLPTDGRARRGATVAYLRQLTVADDAFLLTVVGEVPLNTARKVARSVVVIASGDDGTGSVSDSGVAELLAARDPGD